MAQELRLPAELPPIPHASTDEKLIVGKLVTDLLAAGCRLSVYDGEETTLERSTDAAAIFAALSSTDQDTLYAHKPDGRRSFVQLVWGNGTDVISDYGMSLDEIITPTNFLADQLAEGL